MRGAALAAAAALSACAGVPRDTAGWISGRLGLSVAAQQAQPAQQFSAGFELSGDGASGELRLYTPVGTQIAAARWAPGRATLRRAEGERSFTDLDALALDALGEPVPLAALPDWLAGRAWSAAPSSANATGFEQLGWSVDLSARAQGRIVARRAAPPVVVLRVQLERDPG
ncbi:MAG: outer membrane lipoprotein LolB [Rubrivivax sp.]|nr:outer membrane lipoprotein LolB [Rubrivivax sp.]